MASYSSVIDTKESDGIADPMKKIAIKSHTDHSNFAIGIMLILIDANLLPKNEIITWECKTVKHLIQF